jgi:hypothetical protein
MAGFLRGYYLVRVCKLKLLYGITDPLTVFPSGVHKQKLCFGGSLCLGEAPLYWCLEEICSDVSNNTNDRLCCSPGKSTLIISHKFRE